MTHKFAVKEPIYSFTIPSLSDDLPLDCRIYHPKELDSTLENHDKPALKSAVLAHPYPPLGGSYDDPVILSTCEALLGKGYIVTTFNFRFVRYADRELSNAEQSSGQLAILPGERVGLRNPR